VLALQRTAGNHAVNALIARRRGRLDDEPELEPELDAPGALAAAGAQAPGLGAAAHAQGENIHFAPGQVNLDEDLLGHELWHVRQQRQGRVG
jgi:uncharacterized protein DUF4157